MMDDKKYRIQDAIKSGFNFDFGSYFGGGFSLFGKGAMWFILFVLLYVVYQVVLQVMGALSPSLALILSIGGWVISPAIFAGFYTACHAIQGGDTSPFNRFFDGFKHLLHLFLAQLVQAIILAVLGLIALAPILGKLFDIPWVDIFTQQASQQEIIEAFQTAFGTFGAMEGLMMFVLYLPIIYLTIAWSLTAPFIVLGGMEFWPAMEASRKVITQKFLWVFLFFIVWGLLFIVGIFTLGLAYFVFIPAFFAGMYLMFRDAVGTALDEDHEMDVTDHLVEE